MSDEEFGTDPEDDPLHVANDGYEVGQYDEPVGYFNSGPNEAMGFEISPTDTSWSLIPEFYPDDFTQMKKKDLNRYGGNCGGESVSIKSIKNREFHVSGVVLQGEIDHFQGLLDYDGVVDLYSPLTPKGGMECHIKQGELGNQTGWDPHARQWLFEYNLDLVSTGRDEYKQGKNAIVTAIMQDDPQ